jgi:hypothetical protein
MPKRIAQWNPQRQLWETDQTDLFSAHSEPYSETFPTSGMTRNGQLFPLPASAHPTVGNGSSSLLPTLVVNDMGDNKTLEWWDDFINRHKAKSYNGNGHGRSLSVPLLPTPVVTDAAGTRNSTANRSKPNLSNHTGETLSDVIYSGKLLPTPRATDGTKGGPNQRGSSGDPMLPSAVLDL